MAESGGLFIIDGEDAGSTPWEFDSLTEEGSNTFALDVNAKNNGSYGYRATFDGVNDDCRGVKAFSEVNEIYARAYIYIKADLDLDATSRALTVFALYDGATRICRVDIKAGGGSATPIMWAFDDRDHSATSEINFSRGAWHYIEIHWKAGTGADGGGQFWVDGDLLFDSLDGDHTAYLVDEIRIGGMASTGYPDTNGDTIDFDDIKADTSYIGAYSVDEAIAILRRRRM